MMFTIPDPWREELKLLAGIALMATLAGMLTGQLFPCLLAGILLYTGWHLYQLARLARFLDENPHEEPDPVGAWKDIILRIREQKDNGNIRISELSYQLDRFRNMAKALPDAVVILDQSGRVDWSNPAAADILGILSPESRERLLTALVPDPVLKEYLSNRDFSNSLIIASPTSHEKVLSLLITPLQHEPSPIIIIARDITRQYYLDVTRRDFVANISHELRTPLTVITGLAEQLNTDKPDLTVLPRSTALILQQARRMSELVADLLTLSRLEMQQESATDEHVQIADLLTSIIEEARALSGAAQHVLQLDILSPEGLRGNAEELRTAFSNLIFNAVKHTPNQAEVRVRWQVDHEGAHLSVTDTGEGIAARHIPRLTERLYRVDASHSRSTGGSGLGLAIVKHVLERHEAELDIISAVGGGSTFTCHFPRARVIS